MAVETKCDQLNKKYFFLAIFSHSSGDGSKGIHDQTESLASHFYSSISPCNVIGSEVF